MSELTFQGVPLYVYKDQQKIDAESYIASFESLIGERLPGQYRDFLLACNTARACVYKGFATFTTRDGLEGSIEEFFGQNATDRDLFFYARHMRGRLGPNLIAVGCDALGNITCLGVRGDVRDRVYFWEPIGLPGENVEEDQTSTHLVSDSFDEFISCIEVDED